MSHNAKIWVTLGCIVLLASFLRLYHITSTPPGLYPDEAMDGNNALEVIQTGHFQVFYTEDNGREGLYVNSLVFCIEAFGNKPWVVRLPAAIAGILTIVGMYFLGAELFGAKTGLLSAFLLATSFWHINFSRIGFRAIMAPLCLAFALYWLIRSFRALSWKKAAIFAVLAGIVYAAGFYTYIAYRVTPLLFLLFIPFFKKNPGFWKRAAIFIVTTFIVALPIGIYFLQHPADFFGRTAQISVTNAGNPIGDLTMNLVKTLGMLNFAGDGNWRHNIAGAPELYLPVGMLFLLGIVLAGISLWRDIKKKKNEDGTGTVHYPLFSILLTLAMFILAILPAAASDEGIPHALRSILMLPPAIFFAAIAGVWLSELAKNAGHKKMAMAFSIIFVVIIAINAYVSYFITWAKNPNVPGSFNQDYVDIGNRMNALPQSEPKYVIVDAGGVPARGIPVPAETVMYVTDSFTTSTQIEHHITYLLSDQTGMIPTGTPTDNIFHVR